MAGQKTNNALLAIIAIALIGILGILVYKNFIEKTPEEKIADSVSDTFDSISDAVHGKKD